MPLSLPASLGSTEWLATHLDHPDLVVPGGSLKMPDVGDEWGGQPADIEDAPECRW